MVKDNYRYIKGFINTEIYNHKTIPDYWGTEENNHNESLIFNYVIDLDIVNQDWFDERLKYTNVELLEELLTKINKL